LWAAATATNAQRPVALQGLARSIRVSRTLTPGQAGILADVLEGKTNRPKGGRPAEVGLHRLVVDVYALNRSWHRAEGRGDVRDADIFRYLARIFWPVETSDDGTPTRTKRLGESAIRSIIDKARARYKTAQAETRERVRARPRSDAPPMPSEGGSYVRNPDGSLTKLEGEPAPRQVKGPSRRQKRKKPSA